MVVASRSCALACIRRAVVTVVLLSAVCAGYGAAQAPPPTADSSGRARSWLHRLDARIVAGLFVRPVSLRLDAVDRNRATGLHGEFGLRTAPVAPLCGSRTGGACRWLSRFTVAPHASLGATHLQGINPQAGESAFSSFEVLGVRAGLPITRRIVPYVLYRRGTHSSEQFENGDVVNLWGPGSTRGAGIEVPLTPLGRGFSIAWTEQRGRFDSVETRDVVQQRKVISRTSRPFRATAWQIGWSGPFTGVTWPWQ